MLSMQLNNLMFFAFHGLYEEEKLIGGLFEVNIKIDYLPQTPLITRIEETIDYTSVYSLVKKYMSVSTPLLETVAMNITYSILENFSLAEEVEVAIKKLNPPIVAFEGSVQVAYKATRN